MIENTIIEGWKTEELRNLIVVLTDYTANGSFADLAHNVDYLPKRNYARLVRLTDIRSGFAEDGIWVDKRSYDFLEKSKLEGEEILIANVGAYSGYTFQFHKSFEEKATLGPNMFLIKLDEDCSNKFFYYLFNENNLFEQLVSKAISSAQPKLNKENVRTCIAFYPTSKTEQSRIATALSDIDDLIATTKKLIEKKRNIKEGAMQELLSGKRRLPGFTEKWVEKEVGLTGFTYNGLSGKSKEDFGSGNSLYITFLNVLSNPVIDTSCFEKININPNERQNRAIKGDIFFNTSSETPEEVGFCAYLDESIDNLYLNSFCFGFRITDPEIDGHFISYFWRSRKGRDIMTMLAQGSTRFNLSKALFKASFITIPSTKKEQKAIASVLSDMDSEIQSIESRLTKYQSLKQGMMQQLLTGKIRLI